MGVNQRGFHDWIIQRVSAIVMVGYFAFLLGFFIGHIHSLTFTRWHVLFASTWMKVSTMVILLLLLWHAWIGLWTVLTDYVKVVALRATLQMCIALALVAFFFWGVVIMGSV